MAIDIKELFVTDLDAMGGSWWSKDKVDKINYNFAQLSNGGMIGPQGDIGIDGISGHRGSQGIEGDAGSKGTQGPQGNSDINDWEYFPSTDIYPSYLFPRKNPAITDQISPVSLKIGVDENESASTDKDPSQTVEVNGTVYSDPNDNINVPRVNLRVEHNGLQYGYNFQFLNQEDGTNKFKIFPGISDSTFNVIFSAQKILIKSKKSIQTFNNITTPIFTESISIENSLIKVGENGVENAGLFSLSNGEDRYTKSELKLEYKPTTDNITQSVLVSENADGDLVWKSARSVFGSFPVGSIISIRLDEFKNEHFHLNESIQGSPLNNIYGRGKLGTDFEGWYLCNGETWTGGEENSVEFLTPNLNNFGYVIGKDDINQPSINVSNVDRIVLGAYNLSMKALPDANGKYQIEDNTTYVNNNASPGSFNSFKVSGTSSDQYCESKMIHIVYLENPNLAWKNIAGATIPPSLPVIVTSPIIIGPSQVTSGGNIVSDGGSNIIAKGVVWSTSPSPTITTNQGITSNDAGLNSFVSTLTGLTQLVEYRVRAYATNVIGTSYGDDVVFTVPLNEILIGEQTWTTKNSDIVKYRDGTVIPEFTGTSAEWANLKVGRWCYPDNKLANNATYGKLYNWYAVAGIHAQESTSPTAEQIAARKTFAPVGYHVPSNAEWTTLTNYVNTLPPSGDLMTVGGKMKATGTIQANTGLWNTPNTGATNSSGFSGLPGGYRDSNGTTLIGIGNIGYWWSSSETGTTNAWYRYLSYFRGDISDNVTDNVANKGSGFSVRLIKDILINPLETVNIGTQKWTTKNSDIVKYRDGAAIPEFTGTSAEWANLKVGRWCYPDNKLANNATYGKLYNWYAVAGIHNEESFLDISKRKTFAPVGYHVPSDAEWTTLTNYVNTLPPSGDLMTVGGKMKATGTIQANTGLWNTPNTGATNSSGFSGLPGGNRNPNGSFYSIGFTGFWWSSSEFDTTNAWTRYLYYDYGNVGSNYYYKESGYSVRLIKD